MSIRFVIMVIFVQYDHPRKSGLLEQSGPPEVALGLPTLSEIRIIALACEEPSFQNFSPINLGSALLSSLSHIEEIRTGSLRVQGISFPISIGIVSGLCKELIIGVPFLKML